MKKRFPRLLRALSAGLVLYGYYSAGIYWDYSDDLYYTLYGEKIAVNPLS